MGVKAETSLQKRIQNLIIKRGGYVNKNWGNMTSKPGISDLTCCYKGYYISIEVKEDKGEPSMAQGIHCRKIWHCGGMAFIVWSVEEVKKVLDMIDRLDVERMNIGLMVKSLLKFDSNYVDDGTRW